MNDLATINTANALENPRGLLEAVRASLQGMEADLTTKKGRDAIASAAYGVAKLKTKLDAEGKDRVSGLKAQAAIIDAARKELRDGLDEIKDQVRAPLTQWEEAQARRAAEVQQRIAELAPQLTDENGKMYSSQILRAQLARVESVEITAANFDDQAAQAAIAKDASMRQLRGAIEQAEAAEHAAAEAERMRLEAAEAARQAEIRAAEERARQDAEAKARAELEAQIRAKAEAEARAAEAERRAKEAEERRAAEAARAERAAKEAEERRVIEAELAERRRIEAAENAARAERERAEAAARAEAEAAARREADKAHKAEINRKAVAALVEHAGLNEEQARAVVVAIASGKVPAVKVSY